MDLSVAICTYNRAGILNEALRSLCNQIASKDTYEVIVVDNASTDNTKTVVNRYLDRINVIYAYESKQGLSNSRNRAIECAGANHIAYIDDDIKVKQDWIERIYFIIKEINPDVFGGPIFSCYNSDKPLWFLERYEMVSYGDEPRYLDKNEYLSGGNVVFKKDLLKRLGGFNPSLGMKGYCLGYHEESYFIKKAREIIPNIKVYYDVNIIAYHLIRRNKMSLLYYLKRAFHIARCNKIFYKDQITTRKKSLFKLILKAIREIIAILLKISLGLLFRDRYKYKYPQNYFMDRILVNFDKLFEIINNR